MSRRLDGGSNDAASRRVAYLRPEAPAGPAPEQDREA